MNRITFGLLLLIGMHFAVAMVILLTAPKVEAQEYGLGDNCQQGFAESDGNR